MFQKAYFGQIEKNINSLIADQKYKAAHKLCRDYLTKFPEEKKLLKLKKKIEKIVESENKNVIKEKLKNIKPLWNKKAYAEIIRALTPLLEVAPNNTKLKRLAIRAQDLYRKKVQKLQNNFEQEQTQRLEEVFKNQPGQLLEELSELEQDNPGNQIAKDIIKRYKTKLIRKKIKGKEDLIYSDKYQAIYNLINQLKRIDKNNNVIDELEDLTRRRQHGSQIDEKNEFLYKGQSHLITLMQLKKYDKVIKVATELLETDKKNTEVRKILEKAEKKYAKINREKTIDLIQNNKEDLKREYSTDPKDFVKI